MNTSIKFAKLLRKLAFFLEIRGENQFKIRSYINAAEYIEENNLDIVAAIESGEISQISGFGKAIVDKSIEYIQTGDLAAYQKAIDGIPETLHELTRIKGLGPKKIKTLWSEHGISSIDDLEDACVENRLMKIKGFAAKSQEEIFNSLSHYKASKNKFLQDSFTQSAEDLVGELLLDENIEKAEISGDLRVFQETFSSIKIIAQSKSEAFTLSKDIADKITEIEESGVKIDVSIKSSADYIWELHRTSSSQEYYSAFINRAESLNFKATEDGIYRDANKIITSSEHELYDLLKMQYVEPELREYSYAISKALNNEIPELIKNEDMKGMLHVHTTWSDGRNSLREMALGAKALGFEYIAVCDHSAYAAYANGLSVDRIKEQFAEIDKLNNEDLGIRLLRGIESDILPDGSLDYTPEVLSWFDVVVASVHSSFSMGEREMTDRLIKAVKNPASLIIGHPTGRLLLTRAGYKVNIDEFVQACADYGKVIEINANPYRLDFSWENAIKAKAKGVKLAINPDSHKTDTMKDVFIGVKSARKAWLGKDDIINCSNADEFIKNYVKR
jgi:DNA polymerase (family 10)